MTEIFGNPKKMVIRPYHPTPKDPFNAYAAAQDVRAATMQGTPVAGGQGYGSATSNSTVIIGRDFYAGYRIKIQGTRLGKPYSMHYKYRLDNPTKITLLAYSIPEFADDSNQVKWEGDTGAVSWIIEGSSGQPARPLTSSISTIWLSSSPSFAGISGVCQARLIRSFDGGHEWLGAQEAVPASAAHLNQFDLSPSFLWPPSSLWLWPRTEALA